MGKKKKNPVLSAEFIDETDDEGLALASRPSQSQIDQGQNHVDESQAKVKSPKKGPLNDNLVPSPKKKVKKDKEIITQDTTPIESPSRTRTRSSHVDESQAKVKSPKKRPEEDNLVPSPKTKAKKEVSFQDTTSIEGPATRSNHVEKVQAKVKSPKKRPSDDNLVPSPKKKVKKDKDVITQDTTPNEGRTRSSQVDESQAKVKSPKKRPLEDNLVPSPKKKVKKVKDVITQDTTPKEGRTRSSQVDESQAKVKSPKKRPLEDNLVPSPKKKVKKDKEIITQDSSIEPEPIYSANTCSICSKWFQKSSDLTRHTLVHTKETPFKCQFCPRGFKQESNLRNHIKRVHCGQNNDDDNDGPQPFRCSICKKPAKTWLKLREHLDRHHRGENPNECFVCLKRYKYPRDLYRHERLHSSVKFECHLCPVTKSFTRKDTLDRHIDKFHKNMQFENMERELAKQKGDLDTKIESDTKPIINPDVNSTTLKKKRKKTFDEIKESIENEIDTEIEAETVENKYNCEFCEESFAKRKRLRKHIERNHQVDQDY